MPTELMTLTGAVIKPSLDFLANQQKDKVALVPRLVVHGNGTANVYAFNLVIRNYGNEVAYGIQVGVPWSTFENNGGSQGVITEFWEPRGNLPTRILEYFTKKPVPSWLGKKSLFWTKDVGIALAPGEEIEMYFGQAPCKGETPRVTTGLVWNTGQITSLNIFWRKNGFWGLLGKRQVLRLPFAIHTAKSVAGQVTSALPYWGNAD